MKKIFSILFVFAFLFAFAGTASAQMGMMNYSGRNSAVTPAQSATINAALQDIYTSQKVTDQSKIICASVTDAQFEKLGDAVMGLGITEEQHTAMENMMGGEGSATLAQAHITMGRSYLGCWGNYNSGPAYMPMMGSFSAGFGPGMYGHMGNFGSWGMMGKNYSFHYVALCVTFVLVWIFLILSIIVLIKWLRKNK